MSLAKDMKWTSTSVEAPTLPKKNFESSFMLNCESLTPFSDDAITEFIKNMPGKVSAMHTVLFPNEKRRNSNLKDEIFLSSWYRPENKHKSHFELVEIGKSSHLQISDQELEEIRRLTLCKRTATKFSVALRRGRITGSNFKDCCATNCDDPSITIINSLVNVTSKFENIPSVKYQRRNKAKALKQYINECLETHDNFKYEDCGLIMNSKFPFFATSSDGLVSCDCHGRACVEIKCLKALEVDFSVDALTRGPNSILRKVANEYLFEKNHPYYYQSQMQIHLADLEHCDLVIWSPTDALILRIDSDPLFWNDEKQKAETFYHKVMMPELLGKFYTQNKGLFCLNKSLVSFFDNLRLDLGEAMIENNEDYLELIGPLIEENENGNFELIGLDIELLE